MPVFRYTSRDSHGIPRSGTLAAGSPEMLASDLRGRGLLVIDVQAVDEPSRKARANPGAWPGISSFEVETGFHQLASMLHSGLSLLSGLRMLGDQAGRNRVGAIWHQVADRIEQGSTFADALAACGRVFPEHSIQLVRVGESTGNLDAALQRAAGHLERYRHLRMTVANALAYPAVVTLLAVGVAAFLVVWVIPKLQKYLGGHGRSLPAMTQNLLDVAAFLQTHLPHFAIGLTAIALALVFIRRWPPGRLFLDHLALRIPVAGGVLRLAGTAVFARGLGVLLESGVPLLESLRTVERLLGNRSLRARVATARDAVLRGGTLASPLAEGREFLPMLSRMVAVGENAGTLSQVLDEVARFHEHQILVVIRRMSALIEPVVIIVVGVIVGFVYIAFFLALFSLAGGIR